jgi:hypothetical protein
MPVPEKPEYADRIGSVAQTNFVFLRKLWDPATGPQLRQQFIGANSQEALRALLTEHKIEFKANTRILVVDLENAKTNKLDVDLGATNFYTLVLPPTPQRHPTEPHYKEMQAWSAAYYHAINDSYGM